MTVEPSKAPSVDLQRTSAEKWLSSPLRVFVIALIVAALLAAFTTMQVIELADARGRELAFSRVYVYRFATWAFWAVALVPVVALFRFLRGHFGSWTLAFLVHASLSWFVAGFAMDWRDEMERRMFDSVIRPGAPAAEVERIPGRRFEGRRAPGDPGFEGERPEGRPPGPGGPPRRNAGPGGGPREPQLREPQRNRNRRNAEARAIWRRADHARHIAYYWVLIGLGLGVGAYLQTRLQERRAIAAELRSEKLRTQLAQTQIGTLEAQVQPHFLFNALHAVGGLIRAGEDRTALKTLSSLGSLLRRTLEHGALQRVRLQEELDVVERYLDVEKIRLAERLRLEIDVEADALSALVPSLFLLPLVENSVKYAVSPRTDGGRLRISARTSGETLLLEVEDDGPGFPPEVLEDPEAHENGPDRKHIGLANCQRRVRALYEDRASLEFLNSPSGGALIRLSLPLEKASAKGWFHV